MLATSFILLAVRPNLTQVSVTIPPSTAQRAAESLSREAGITVSVQQKLANEIVAVRAVGQPVQRVLDELAYVLHARCTATAEGYLISRPREDQLSLEAAELATRTKKLQSLLDKKNKELGKAPTPTARAHEFLEALKKQRDYFRSEKESGRVPKINISDVRRASPAGRLAAELAIALGARAAAEIPDFGTEVYSNQPIKGQKKLPPELKPYIDSYVEVDEQLGLIADESMIPQEILNSPYNDIFRSALLHEGVGKVRLTIHREGDYYSYLLDAYTKKGSIKGYAGFDPKLYRETLSPPRAGEPKMAPLSPLTAEFLSLASGHSRPGEVGEDLAKALSEGEPLQLSCWDALIAVSEGRNLAACLSDELTQGVLESSRGSEVNLSELTVRLDFSGGTEMTTHEAFVRLRPSSPVSTEASRCDRKALRLYVSAILKERRETLATLAQFHFTAGPAVSSNPTVAAIGTALSSLGLYRYSQSAGHSHEFFAMLGAIGVKPGTTTSLSSMTGEQVEAINRWGRFKSLYGETRDLPDLMKTMSEALRGESPTGNLQQQIAGAGGDNVIRVWLHLTPGIYVIEEAAYP